MDISRTNAYLEKLKQLNDALEASITQLSQETSLLEKMLLDSRKRLCLQA